MKNRILDQTPAGHTEVIATFGEAQLVRVRGRLELRGGSMADRTEALEWLALFHPDEARVVKR